MKPCLEGGERTFSFPAADGPTTGVMLGRGRTGVVLGHQAGSDLCEWLPRARVLAGHGRQVLAFDFGQGGHLRDDMAAAAAAKHHMPGPVRGRPRRPTPQRRRQGPLPGRPGRSAAPTVEFGGQAPQVRKVLDQFLQTTLGAAGSPVGVDSALLARSRCSTLDRKRPSERA